MRLLPTSTNNYGSFVAGFYLFGPSSESQPGSPYFKTLLDSFINLFVLLTTANYPGRECEIGYCHFVVFFIPIFCTFASIVFGILDTYLAR
jgi:hypothetical protein